jgi:hypothetical protein
VCGSNGLADKTSNVSKANLNKHPYFDGYQVGFFYYCFINMTRDNFLGCSWDIALSIHGRIEVEWQFHMGFLWFTLWLCQNSY